MHEESKEHEQNSDMFTAYVKDTRNLSRKKLHVLMVYPEFFPTYWGMHYYLPLVGKKALMPPLGLLTIAAMCPPEYEIRVVDMNCQPLTDETIDWADMILFSAMLPQKNTLLLAAERCHARGKFLIVGGPYPTACPEECEPYFDVVVMNEGEITWPLFLKDIARGHYKKIYSDEEKPDITQTPCPRLDLLNLNDYSIIPVQFSRGCPFQCEFCDIIVMYGRRPRTKTPAQLCLELDAIYETGYRGIVFIVDDNFIGNKIEAFKLLPHLKVWNEAHHNPFVYGTEASINLAEDPQLIQEMVAANFIWVFIGIETPSIESLKETKKFQNTRTSLLDSIKAIQQAGILIHGGFIIGFDHDREDIFERQMEFVKQAAITNVMIGPLVALPKTPLYHRMKKEGRLKETQDDHIRTLSSGYTNLITKIPRKKLLGGHKKILTTIYQPEAYFSRAFEAFLRLPRPKSLGGKIRRLWWLASIISRNMKNGTGHRLSLIDIFKMFPADFRRASLRFSLKILWRRWENFPRVMGCILHGYHFYKFTFDHVAPELERYLEQKEILSEMNAA